MKHIKIATAAIILLLGTNAFSQKFSLADLRRLNKMSMDTFKVEMEVKHKFVFANKELPPEYPYTYHAYELQKDGTTLTMEKIIYTNGKLNSITYNTIYKADLDSISAQLLKEGYKVKTTSKTFGNSIYITDYTLNGMEVQIVVPITNNALRYGITVR